MVNAKETKKLYRKAWYPGVEKAHVGLEASELSRSETIRTTITISITTPLRAKPASRLRLPMAAHPISSCRFAACRLPRSRQRAFDCAGGMHGTPECTADAYGNLRGSSGPCPSSVP